MYYKTITGNDAVGGKRSCSHKWLDGWKDVEKTNHDKQEQTAGKSDLFLKDL